MEHPNLPRAAGFLLFLLTVTAGRAQLPSLNFSAAAGPPGTDFATMSRLLGSHTGFSARYEVRMYDKRQQETISAAMNFAYHENKIRMDIDLAQMKNQDLPAGIGGQLKQLGMDQVVTVIRPDKQSIYVMYPRLESCLTQPLPPATANNSKMEKRAIGKEIMDGQACVKHQVTFTATNGWPEELTVWFATDLKDFPVQVLTKQNDETVIARFKQIQLNRPEARLFDLPAGFKEYSDTQAFMQGVMAKILAGSLPDSK